MEIYINTKNWCEIQNNYWFLPTLDEINLIIHKLNIMKETVSNTNIEKYNNDLMKQVCSEQTIIKPKAKRPKKWIIYIIKTGKYYKIWRTIDINKRFRKYITENPLKVELIYYYYTDDYIKEEENLHNIFEHKKHNREWFNLNKDDILLIKTLKDEI